MPEELGLPYRMRAVDIHAKSQFSPEFLEIHPNNEMTRSAGSR